MRVQSLRIAQSRACNEHSCGYSSSSLCCFMAACFISSCKLALNVLRQLRQGFCTIVKHSLKCLFYSHSLCYRVLQDRFPTVVPLHFSAWREYMYIGTYWSTVCCKNYLSSSNSEFLELSCCYIKQSRKHDVCVHSGCQTMCIPSFMSKQSPSQDQMMLYTIYWHRWHFRLHSFNGVIKISDFFKVLITYQKWRYFKFLWRPNQVHHLLQMFFSQLSHSLMMAMIIILRCGDVEVNPGPQTSK